MSNTFVQEIVKKVQSIKPLSDSAMRLLETVNKDDYDMATVSAIVERDPGLTANVLKVVNAPAFGLGQNITSVARAVSFLGEKTIVAIALGSCSPSVLNAELEGYASERGEMWEHSLCTAIAAREVARFAKGQLALDQVFTAGILHDIGKAVISEYLSGKVEDMLRQIEKEEAPGFVEAERKELGGDHTLVGYVLARHWKLPDPLQQAILHHHRPEGAEEQWRPIVYSVHMGDILAMMAGFATGADALQYTFDDGYDQYISMNEQDLRTSFF